MKAAKSAAKAFPSKARNAPAPKQEDPYKGFAYRPGPLSVPRSVIRKAVIKVIKARMERELGRPVKVSELKRDPRLPPILEPTWLRKLARASARKTAPSVSRKTVVPRIASK